MEFLNFHLLHAYLRLKDPIAAFEQSDGKPARNHVLAISRILRLPRREDREGI